MLFRSGILPASYNMVEVPSEAENPLISQEAKPAKPQAAVKNVTPEQPAPASVAAEEKVEPVQPAPASNENSGFLGRILGWFRTPHQPTASHAESSAPVEAPKRDAHRDREEGSRRGRGQDRGTRNPERQDRSEGRNAQRGSQERNERGHHPRGDRQDRGAPRHGERTKDDRPERSPRNETSQGASARPDGRRDGRDGRNGRRRDGERSPRETPETDPSAQVEQKTQAPAASAGAESANAPGAEQRPPRPEGERGGRRRGGRNRNREGRPHSDRQATDGAGHIALPPPISIEEAMAPVGATQSPDIQEAVSTKTPASETAGEKPHLEVSSGQLPLSTPPETNAPTAGHAEAEKEKSAEPEASVREVGLQQALQSSGLQLVETRFKSEPIPEPAFVPAKRERRPPPPAFNEPLAQVETNKAHSAPPQG